jgi:hypothetical protein
MGCGFPPRAKRGGLLFWVLKQTSCPPILGIQVAANGGTERTQVILSGRRRHHVGHVPAIGGQRISNHAGHFGAVVVSPDRTQ